MAAEAGPGAQIDAAQVWRAIGQVEGEVRGLREEVHGLREDVRGVREEVRGSGEEARAEMAEMRRRIDRLLYLGIATALALLGAVITTQVLG